MHLQVGKSYLLACMYYPHGLREGTKPYKTGESCSDNVCGADKSKCVCKNEYDQLYNKTLENGVESLDIITTKMTSKTTTVKPETSTSFSLETPEETTRLPTKLATTMSLETNKTLAKSQTEVGKTKTAEKPTVAQTPKSTTEKVPTNSVESESKKSRINVIKEVVETTAPKKADKLSTTKQTISVTKENHSGSASFYNKSYTINCVFSFVLLTYLLLF